MDFALSAQQDSIRDAILKICSRFDDAYWLAKDHDYLLTKFKQQEDGKGVELNLESFTLKE